MEFDNYTELYHHGIKGMKWGVRRFQNKDGSLTNAGGKRYNGSDYKPRRSITQTISDYRTASKRKKNLVKARKAAAEKRKVEAEAKAKAEQRRKDVEEGKISARKMTADELNSRINKLNLEKKYKQLMEETDPSAKGKSIASGFVKKMWNDAVVPAMADAGKQILKDKLLKAANKKSKDELASEALAKMAKDWKNKADIARDKKNAWKNDQDLKEMKKKVQDDARSDNEKRSQQEYERETGGYSRNGKQVSDSKIYTKYPNTNKEENPKQTINSGKLLGDGVERFRTTADDDIGEGTSRYEYSKQGARYYDNNPIWRDGSSSSKTYSSSVSAGQKYLETSKSSTLSLPYKSSASENSNSSNTKNNNSTSSDINDRLKKNAEELARKASESSKSVEKAGDPTKVTEDLLKKKK